VSALLEMSHICKRFGAVQALNDVGLYVNPGEVLGLIGDNAAGKTTLMKILTGAYHADSGTMRWQGKPVQVQTPEHARALGIEMVYQDLALCNNLDVCANVFLGREMTRGHIGPFQLLDRRGMRRRTQETFGRMYISLPDPAQRAETLSGGQRQAVAIGRATTFDAKLVVMDEPTAALSLLAIEQVHRMIGQLKRHKTAVILISHRLDDVLSVCDRVMVLRQGQGASVRTVIKNDDGRFRQTLIRDMEGLRDADQDPRWGQRLPHSGASCGVTPFS